MPRHQHRFLKAYWTFTDALNSLIFCVKTFTKNEHSTLMLVPYCSLYFSMQNFSQHRLCFYFLSNKYLSVTNDRSSFPFILLCRFLRSFRYRFFQTLVEEIRWTQRSFDATSVENLSGARRRVCFILTSPCWQAKSRIVVFRGYNIVSQRLFSIGSMYILQSRENTRVFS